MHEKKVEAQHETLETTKEQSGPLTPARALLQRARAILRGGHSDDLAVEISTFLAGLPVTSAELPAARPRVGEWVDVRSSYWARYDDHGREAASAWDGGPGWCWSASQGFLPTVFSIDRNGTVPREQAMLSADTVLRTWADIDGEVKGKTPRTWTEEEIRMAFAVAKPGPIENFLDAIVRELKGTR